MLDARRPLRPPPRRLGQFAVDIQCFRLRLVRGEPRQRQVDVLALVHRDRSAVAAPRRPHTCTANNDGVGARDGQQGGAVVVARLPHPGYGPRVVESQRDRLGELHRAAHPDDPAHEGYPGGLLGHEVPHLRDGVRALPAGDEHEGIAVVAPGCGSAHVERTQAPASVLVVTEKGAEDRWGVVAGHAQPVDAALPRYERSGSGVTEHGVIGDGCRHRPDCVSPIWESRRRLGWGA